MVWSNNTPFTRVFVDHMFVGTTRVWWQIDSSFRTPGPYTFQLQASFVGTPNALDWVDIGDEVVNAYFIDTTVRREFGGARAVTHYRIKLTLPDTTVYYSGAANLHGSLTVQDAKLAQELIRKERLNLQAVSRPGYLLKRMRYGAIDPSATDPLTQEVIDSHSLSSWGTPFKVGYHPPVPVAIDVSPGVTKEPRSGDTVAGDITLQQSARILAYPEIAAEDVWVDAANDKRWLLHDIQIAVGWRGVPLVYNVEMRLVPFDSVIYRIPVDSSSADPQWPTASQPTTGTGCVTVDHNYQDPDALSYVTANCCAVVGANIAVFHKEDWDNNLRDNSRIVANSQTTTEGRWAYAVQLDPGDYVVRFEKPGEYGPDTVEITVTSLPPSSSSSATINSSSSSFGPF